MMRRSSNRLRGGSVPPPDSDIVVPTPADASRRGRGRGRGRGNSSASTRGQTQSSSTPTVTLTIPGEEPAATSPGPNAPPSASPNNQDPPSAAGTSVIHSVGLLSRDDVNNGPNSKLNSMITTKSDAADGEVQYVYPRLVMPPRVKPLRTSVVLRTI